MLPAKRLSKSLTITSILDRGQFAALPLNNQNPNDCFLVCFKSKPASSLKGEFRSWLHCSPKGPSSLWKSSMNTRGTVSVSLPSGACLPSSTVRRWIYQWVPHEGAFQRPLTPVLSPEILIQQFSRGIGASVLPGKSHPRDGFKGMTSLPVPTGQEGPWALGSAAGWTVGSGCRRLKKQRVPPLPSALPGLWRPWVAKPPGQMRQLAVRPGLHLLSSASHPWTHRSRACAHHSAWHMASAHARIHVLELSNSASPPGSAPSRGFFPPFRRPCLGR